MIYTYDVTFVLKLVNYFPFAFQPSSDGSSYATPPPVVVKLETGFKPIKSPSAMTVSIRNYDGTEKHQMLHQEEGFEVVTEMLLSQEGKLLSKSCRRGLI